MPVEKTISGENLNLQRRSFKPNPASWEEFRHISLAYGLGMCKLFVILVELEQKRWHDAGEPENFFEKAEPDNGVNCMNSNHLDSHTVMNALEKILKSRKHALLIRNIDFEQLRLDRIGLVFP